MSDKTADQLFEYLKNVIYDPTHASLDESALPEDFKMLGQGMIYLNECVTEQRQLADAIARGDFSTPPPSVENVLASSTKAIQGMLRHLTWQTQQVAAGDYSQHLDFMGEFSVAFNTMVQQLKERQDALEADKELLLRHNRELQQTHDLFLNLTEKSTQMIFVCNSQTHEILYENNSAVQFFSSVPYLKEEVLKKLQAAENVSDRREWEIDVCSEPDCTDADRFFQVSTRELPWRGESAVTHMITDITSFKIEHDEMVRLAFQDSLTGLFNRRYGMNQMQKWLGEQKTFSLSFADIDYLKYCNDVYGHEAGDEYILLVAHILCKLPNATVCRVGGDEFLIISPEPNTASLEQQLSALRQELIDIPLPEGQEYTRSFSYGVVSSSSGDTLSETMSIADEKMYKFKFDYKRKMRLSGTAKSKDRDEYEQKS